METKKVKVLFCNFSIDNPNNPVVLVGNDKLFGTKELKEKISEQVLSYCDELCGENKVFAKQADKLVSKLANGKDAVLTFPFDDEEWEFFYGEMELLC